VFQRIADRGSRVTELARAGGDHQADGRFPRRPSSNAPGTSSACRTPDDGRARLVRITERGARSVAASAGIVAEVEAEWTAHLGVRRMDQLRQILADLREITDPWR
jgi:hypothetical protein